ncbi:MAG: SprT family zinc-dependent metalloprotease [Christensenellaceae bacterium]
MKIELSDGSSLKIEISKKEMKSIRLRVCNDGRVCVSAPEHIDDARIYDFVCSKKGWIESHIKNMVKAPKDDTVIRFMGVDYAVETVKDRRTGVALNDKNMTVFCSDPLEYKKIVQKWWVEQSIQKINDFVDKWYLVFAQFDVPKPEIKIRRMKTLWGSCTATDATIRINYFLMCAPADSIEYVILHEMTHLLHQNHGKEFKDFLTKYMPDWKERKRALEQEYANIQTV